jgi:hypothetical protein
VQRWHQPLTQAAPVRLAPLHDGHNLRGSVGQWLCQVCACLLDGIWEVAIEVHAGPAHTDHVWVVSVAWWGMGAEEQSGRHKERRENGSQREHTARCGACNTHCK